MSVPSPNILLALFILSFSLSAIFHRSTTRATPSNPTPPNVFSHYAADILVPSTNDTFPSRPGAFGGLFEGVLRGKLVIAWDDGLACHDICRAGTANDVMDNLAEDQSVEVVDGDVDGSMGDMFGENDGVDGDVDGLEKYPFRGKIVLVRRGKCSFAEKVRKVQKEGGIAVVVGDNAPSSGLLTMYAKGDTSDITIPSTFIPHASYLSLLFLLSLPPPLEIIILPSTASDWPLLDTLLLVVLSPLFTLACIYILLILRRRVQRRRELAPLSVVKSLPSRRWTREKDEEDEQSAGPVSIPEGYGTRTRRAKILECVVCLEDFVEGDVVTTLPCDHDFHESGVDGSTPWLTTRRRVCPICKRDIITPVTEEVDERSPLLAEGAGDWRGETAGNV